MDVTTYYQKIRETETGIASEFVVVQSIPTDDGGKGGVLVEVARRLAAKMLVEGSAVMASADQAAAFQQAQAAASKAAREATEAAKIAISMVPSDDLKKLADDLKKLKSAVRVPKE